jgi:DNA-directed RNA polymerase subunit H (RpoH/RPB5)
MELEETWRVYENLFKFAASRGVNVTGDRLDHRRFAEYITHHGHVTVKGARRDTLADGSPDIRGAAAALFVITLPSSEGSKKKKDLYSVIPAEVKETTEIIVFTKDAPTKNAMKAVGQYHAANPLARLSIFEYTLCTSDTRAHALVSPHRIATPDDIEDLKMMHIHMMELPQIKVGEPQVEWLGARKGMIIAEDRYTETAGIMPTYMIVV